MGWCWGGQMGVFSQYQVEEQDLRLTPLEYLRRRCPALAADEPAARAALAAMSLGPALVTSPPPHTHTRPHPTPPLTAAPPPGPDDTHPTCTPSATRDSDRLGSTRIDSERLGSTRTDSDRLRKTRIDSDRLGSTRNDSNERADPPPPGKSHRMPRVGRGRAGARPTGVCVCVGVGGGR